MHRERSSAAVSGNELDIDQPFMKRIVATNKLHFNQLISYGDAQMSKLVSVGLIAAAMFATPEVSIGQLS